MRFWAILGDLRKNWDFQALRFKAIYRPRVGLVDMYTFIASLHAVFINNRILYIVMEQN
jgi:hypothetical protein